MKHIKLFEGYLDDLGECLSITEAEYMNWCKIVENMSVDEIKTAGEEVKKIEEFLGREFLPQRWKQKKNSIKWGYSNEPRYNFGRSNDSNYTFFRSDDGWIIANIFIDQYNHIGKSNDDLRIVRTNFPFKCDQIGGLSKLSETLIQKIKSKDY